MASVVFSCSAVLAIPPYAPRICCSKNLALAPNPSQLLCSKSVLKLKRQTVASAKLRNNKTSVVCSVQSNFFRVVQTVWKIGKDAVEAGTNLVPEPIPRPIARISVTVVALTVGLFVLKSFISTAFFVLAMMGLIYFAFIALNKDEGRKPDPGSSSTSTSVEDSLEEARRIMGKYK